MRAVSFLGAALIVTGAAAGAAGFGAEGGGTAGFGAEGGGMPGRAPMGGRPGAEGGRGGEGGGTSGRVAELGGGSDDEGGGSGACPPILVVSFFGPGVLMRTVSRLTVGAGSPALGGRVMRTVSFLGIEGLSGLDAEGSSSDIIKGEEYFLSHPRSILSNISHVRSAPDLIMRALTRFLEVSHRSFAAVIPRHKRRRTCHRPVRRCCVGPKPYS